MAEATEIQTVARLDHHAIIRIFGATLLVAHQAQALDVPAGSLCYVMERAEGGSLAATPPSSRQALAVLRRLLAALAHAHVGGCCTLI